MYNENPKSPDAYTLGTQYYFGKNIIVSPIVTFQIDKLLMGKAKVYLLEGKYYNSFLSIRSEGGINIMMYITLEEFPILIKIGDIIHLSLEKIADVN